MSAAAHATPLPTLPGFDLDQIRAAAAGDRKAAQAVLAALLPRARNLIRYLIRGDRDVDDIAQEALLAVLRGLPTYRGDGAFTSWTDRIVARTTFAALRRGRAAPFAMDPTSLESVPDQRADEYVDRRELARALDGVPEDQRHALVLHHALGMTVPEIAEELGAPFETVRSRLRLGMATLRQQLLAGRPR